MTSIICWSAPRPALLYFFFTPRRHFLSMNFTPTSPKNLAPLATSEFFLGWVEGAQFGSFFVVVLLNSPKIFGFPFPVSARWFLVDGVERRSPIFLTHSVCRTRLGTPKTFSSCNVCFLRVGAARASAHPPTRPTGSAFVPASPIKDDCQGSCGGFEQFLPQVSLKTCPRKRQQKAQKKRRSIAKKVTPKNKPKKEGKT